MDRPICSLQGIVVHGKQIGRTIGFPTANLALASPCPHLVHGVYGVIFSRNEKQHYGVMNIGLRPTFQDHPQISYEVHVFDCNEDMYDERVIVEVCFYVRPEIAFSDVNQLRRQIQNDVNRVKIKFGLVLQVEVTGMKAKEVMLSL